MKKPILTMRDWIEGLRFGAMAVAIDWVLKYFGLLSSCDISWINSLVYFMFMTVFWAFGYRYFLSRFQKRRQ